MRLTNGQILRELEEYISEEIYDYALMLDGKWGSGKTYFVREIVFPRLTQVNKRPLYISLFGLKSKEDISDEIYLQFIKQVTKDKYDLLPFGFSVLRYFRKKYELDEIPIEEVSERIAGAKLKDYVLFFDDLERCTMNINDAMGAINSLIEQHHFKSIIVANEVEIGTIQEHNNLELKYILASGNNLEYPDKDDDGAILNRGSKGSGKPDLVSLKARAHYLFEENELYIRIKEKVIGRTVHYCPEIDVVSAEIFESMKPKLSPYIADHKAEILKIVCEEYASESYNNMRTLQFSLALCDRILNTILSTRQYDAAVSDTINVLIRAIIRMSIYYKNGKQMIKWEEGKEYGRVTFGRGMDLSKYFTAFKFIQDYISNSEFSSGRITTVISDYIRTEERDPFYAINYFWQSDDTEVEAALNVACRKILKGEYHPTEYPELVGLLMRVKEIGFEFDFDNIYEFMKSDTAERGSRSASIRQLLHRNEYINENVQGRILELTKIREDADLKMCMDDLRAQISSGHGWGERFSLFLQDRKGDMYHQKTLMKFVDIETLVEALNNSKTEDFSNFRRALNSFYDNGDEFVKTDITKLKDFLVRINNEKYAQRTKEFNRMLLITHLEEISKRSESL